MLFLSLCRSDFLAYILFLKNIFFTFFCKPCVLMTNFFHSCLRKVFVFLFDGNFAGKRILACCFFFQCKIFPFTLFFLG